MKKVLVDLGHGGSDSGATGNGLIEKHLNLQVGLSVKEYLKKYNVDIKLTREADITLTADQRIKIIKEYNPDLCVSLHHNAAGDTKARGAEIIHAHYDLYDDKLALSILNKLAKAGMPTRRSFTKLNDKKTDWYYMIRRVWDSTTTAIIIEGGFISNTQDAAILKTAEYIKAQAQAIAEGIVEYLNLQPLVSTQEEEFIKAMDYIGKYNILDLPMYWLVNAEAGKTIPGDLVQALIIKLVNHAKRLNNK